MLGVSLAAAHVVSRYGNRWVLATSVAVLLLLAVRTFDQAGTWTDRLTLYRHAVAVAPASRVAHNNYGTALLARGDFGGAEMEVRRAIELKSDYVAAHSNLALALDAQGRYEELIEQLEQLQKLSPSPQTQEWLDAARVAARGATTRPSPPSPASRPS
jgi:Flp pilus assembly protein TadD